MPNKIGFLFGKTEENPGQRTGFPHFSCNWRFSQVASLDFSPQEYFPETIFDRISG
jgi:hypothetical protein